MQRRDFLMLGTTTLSLAGSAAAMASSSTPPAAPVPAPAGAKVPPVLGSYTAGDHRRRLENIAHAQRHIRRCLGQHLVTSYLPGQCCYNLGEYPCRKPWDPDDWDERALDELQAHGIRLIQVHEEWNDSQRLFGSHKLAALNPAGFRRFVEMVHRRGMRLIVYVSSGFFDRKDPDFRRSGPCSRTCARSTSRMPIARRPVPGGGPTFSATWCGFSTTMAWTASTTTWATCSREVPTRGCTPAMKSWLSRRAPCMTAPWRIFWG